MSKKLSLDGYEVIKTTAAAVLIEDMKSGEETWIPRSVCEDGQDLSEGDTDLVVEAWFVDDKGLSV